MKITILGSGLMGVTSAYYLRKAGYEVEVIDRQAEVAMETSFANGGQISVCYSEPWSTVNNLKKIYEWIGKEDSPILFRPEMNIKQLEWGIRFLKECIPGNTEANIKQMLKLAMFSRNSLKQLRDETKIKYEERLTGILTYYTSYKGYEAGKNAAEFMNQFGAGRVIKTQDETFEIEPCLKKAQFTVFGSDYSADDESGNAKMFTDNLAKICQKMGVTFKMNEEIILDMTEIKDGNIKKVYTKNKETEAVTKQTSDLFLVCLGSYTPEFLKKLERMPIYPVKGYSATFDVTDWSKANSASLTDSEYKIVFTRVGNKLRVAGTAEFNGYNLDLNTARCETLRKRTKEIFGEGFINYDEPNFWTGLRPATPGNVPIIKRIKDSNVYVNSGHGTLGWTMACGSARVIADIIGKQKQ